MSQTSAELAADIARQREQLATTVDLLQSRVRATAIHQAKVAGIVAGAAVAVLLSVVVVRRLRH